MRTQPSSQQLRELLDYDPKTGALTWKPRTTGLRPDWWNKRYAGRPAGYPGQGGCIILKIDDCPYLAHRIIWAMVHGTWPECVVHRNGKLSDNRLANLRDMSRKAVQRQPVIYRTNSSGIRGVSWCRQRKKWVASIGVDDVTIYLGGFADIAEAKKARRAAERRRDRLGL